MATALACPVINLSCGLLVLVLASFLAHHISLVQGFSMHHVSRRRNGRLSSAMPNEQSMLQNCRSTFEIKPRSAVSNDDAEDSITTILPTEISSSRPKPQQSGHCRFCSQTFASRNALFRHLSTDSKCASLAGNSIDIRPKAPTTYRYELALLFGYHDSAVLPTEPTSSEAERAGNLLLEAFESALGEMVSGNDDSTHWKILSCTQSSIARMRHKILSQETSCAGVGDVMVVSWRQNAAINRQPQQEEVMFISRLMDRIQHTLDCNTPTGLQVRLQACKWLDDHYHIHAERACTQRVYHYLLPVAWLPDGNDIRAWWIDKTNVTGGDVRRFARPQASKRSHEERHGPDSRMPSPPESLQRFKYLLRQVESEELFDALLENVTETTLKPANDIVVDHTKKRAAGRFGTMARRERRPWHNYADPSLQGDASPNNEPVWRVVDRARVVSFLTDDANDNVMAVLEFRGDEFMPQQIRRIIGTMVAMSHGWLPADMLNVSTSSSQFLETALAPPGRLYLAGLRFHFDEMRTGGKTLFESNIAGKVVMRSSSDNSISRRDDDDDSHYPEDLAWIQNLLLEETRRHKTLESLWLEELESVVAPRIRHQLKRLTSTTSLTTGFNSNSDSVVAVQAAPAAYERTLCLLRDIVESNAWPATTAARSSVILASNHDSDDDNNDNKNKVNKGGSFTVLNPSVLKERYYSGKPLPLGNVLFPELAKAVFDLEASLSQRPHDDGDTAKLHRLSSSHCAINCNAQFTPHVDSGRGAGQSLSMIVGLGNYRGGELAVEGTYHDIQYRPLEFDGWKMRHWTLPFDGERFSLVWFTPHTEPVLSASR